MKKQLAEHIINLVKHGHDVAVKNRIARYAIFKGLNPNGNFYGTHSGETIEECKGADIWEKDFSNQHLQNYFTDEYEIVTEPPIPYKKGDLVDILPIAKELSGFGGWRDEGKEMVGQKGLEIKYICDDGSYGVYTKDKSDWFAFPHWCIAPHFQEEPEYKMEEVIELLKKNGYKVIKE